jgi:hypothetical protein
VDELNERDQVEYRGLVDGEWVVIGYMDRAVFDHLIAVHSVTPPTYDEALEAVREEHRWSRTAPRQPR